MENDKENSVDRDRVKDNDIEKNKQSGSYIYCKFNVTCIKSKIKYCKYYTWHWHKDDHDSDINDNVEHYFCICQCLALFTLFTALDEATNKINSYWLNTAIDETKCSFRF